jgi:integrase/recombinase XerD
MSDLRPAISDYLALRRALGNKLAGYEDRLEQFVSFLERKGASHITAHLALQWAQHPANATMKTWNRNLAIVRGFAQYVSATDPKTQVPPTNLLPFDACRAKPYIYTEAEILRLMEAARAIRSFYGLRGQTYYCLIGLLAVTGLRIGEALNLRRQDVDLDQGLLTVNNGKFGKSRLVPIHTTTVEALADYSRRRDAFLGNVSVPSFFVNEPNKTPLSAAPVRDMFRKLSRRVGIRSPQDRRGPRLHDIRHRFAVETLLGWYRRGEDVQRQLPVLSTFLGHDRIQDTYWYLSSTPELLGAAGDRLEHRWEEPR